MQKPPPKKKGRKPYLNPFEDQKERRLELNRQSAKESRKRKKMYITNMEEQNRMLMKENTKLQRKISNMEDRMKLTTLSSTGTTQQLIDGRENMYDRLQDCIDHGGKKQEIDDIISQLRMRTGSYGAERKNLVNNLFKNIIDLSFPNIVKWLFIECER